MLELMAHQRAALQKVDSCRGVCGLFMEQGTGKSRTALAYAEQTGKTLIVCRKDNIGTWRDEIKKWTNSSYVLAEGSSKQRLKLLEEGAFMSGVKYVVVNYDCLRNKEVSEYLESKASFFDLVVFDESVEIKNHASNRNKAWREIAWSVPRRILLDGRPISAGLEDIFGQYLILDKGRTFGDNFWKFKRRFFTCINEDYHIWVPKENAERDIRNRMQYSSFRVEAKDCLDLPEKSYINIYPELTKEQEKHYNTLKDEFYANINGVNLELSFVIQKITKLHQVVGGFLIVDGKQHLIESGKMASLKTLLSSLSYKPKLVVWAAFKCELDMIRNLCQDIGMKSAVYSGDVSPFEREKIRKDFLNGDLKVFIGQVSTGVGLNELVVADTAIYYSNSYSLREREQSEKRIDRMGQRNNMVIYDLIVPKTIDEAIYQNLKNKKNLSDSVLSTMIKKGFKECL